MVLRRNSIPSAAVYSHRRRECAASEGTPRETAAPPVARLRRHHRAPALSTVFRQRNRRGGLAEDTEEGGKHGSDSLAGIICGPCGTW